MAETEAGRPEFLREEEELQRRLAELQMMKKKAKEEQEQRIARTMQEKMQIAEHEVIRMMMIENQKMKEEIKELKKGNQERASPVAEEFNTPEERGETTLFDEVAKKLRLDEEGRHYAGQSTRRDGGGVDFRASGSVPGGDPAAGDTMKFMMMMMLESMQQLIKDRDAGKGGNDTEVVKTTVELPKLPEWNHETGPIDLGDWIATIDPFMEDLSDSAEVWWKTLRKEAMAWYEEHMAMSPLDRLTHEVKPSPDLSKAKWSRLERRAAGLLIWRRSQTPFERKWCQLDRSRRWEFLHVSLRCTNQEGWQRKL